MKGVVFDLDETILYRSRSLVEFTIWQAEGMLRNSLDDPTKYSRRFIELDSNGRVWKDEVYRQLISEFGISDWSLAELLSSYELCFSGFCIAKPKIIDAIGLLYEKGYKLGLVSFEMVCNGLNLAAEEVIFVGDNPKSDIDGANSCGMYTVYVPGFLGDTYLEANITCEDFGGLVEIVEKAN